MVSQFEGFHKHPWVHVYAQYPTLYTDVTWLYYMDRQSIRTAQVGDLLDTLRLIQRDVGFNLPNSTIGIKLDEVLEDYQEQLLLARIPLFLILFLVAGILTKLLICLMTWL